MKVSTHEFYEALIKQCNDDRSREYFRNLRDRYCTSEESGNNQIEFSEKQALAIKKAQSSKVDNGVWGVLPARTPRSKMTGVITRTGDIYNPYIHRRFLPAQVSDMLCRLLYSEFGVSPHEGAFPEHFNWERAFSEYRIWSFLHLMKGSHGNPDANRHRPAMNHYIKTVITSPVNYTQLLGNITDQALEIFYSKAVNKYVTVQDARRIYTQLSSLLMPRINVWFRRERDICRELDSYGGYDRVLQRYFFEIIEGEDVDKLLEKTLYESVAEKCEALSIRNVLLWYAIIGLWGFGITKVNIPATGLWEITDGTESAERNKRVLEEYLDVQKSALRETNISYEDMERYGLTLFKLAVRQVWSDESAMDF